MQEKLENRSTDDTLLPLVAAHILSNSWTSILASPFPIFGLLGRLKNMVSQAYLKSLDEGLLEETGECLPSLAEIILSDPPLQDCLSDRYLAWKEFLQEHSEMSLCQTFAFVSLLVLCPQHVNLAANIFLRQAGEILSPQGIKFGILALVTPWPIWDNLHRLWQQHNPLFVQEKRNLPPVGEFPWKPVSLLRIPLSDDLRMAELPLKLARHQLTSIPLVLDQLSLNIDTSLKGICRRRRPSSIKLSLWKHWKRTCIGGTPKTL